MASRDDAGSGKNQQDAIPWPALTKLHPSKLTRTASNLMAEWEKSLTPPNERVAEENTPKTTRRKDH
jgi:hypothetical protein